MIVIIIQERGIREVAQILANYWRTWTVFGDLVLFWGVETWKSCRYNIYQKQNFPAFFELWPWHHEHSRIAVLLKIVRENNNNKKQRGLVKFKVKVKSDRPVVLVKFIFGANIFLNGLIFGCYLCLLRLTQMWIRNCLISLQLLVWSKVVKVSLLIMRLEYSSGGYRQKMRNWYHSQVSLNLNYVMNIEVKSVKYHYLIFQNLEIEDEFEQKRKENYLILIN